ncbi:hypothetical protein C5167_000925 [Papaver somniferum]|uniref:Uncharacterized protein n=1 Tax=Papaver somniferum TaxID=3469 RepID=A0A4Y7KTY3_PAPSO|nr:hypothetical protein C5167_000925 [Papaver somniferum]
MQLMLTAINSRSAESLAVKRKKKYRMRGSGKKMPTPLHILHSSSSFFSSSKAQAQTFTRSRISAAPLMITDNLLNLTLSYFGSAGEYHHRLIRRPRRPLPNLKKLCEL